MPSACHAQSRPAKSARQSGIERPIFVFSAGWRTGSTLVQRILCSHPDIHIWGENHGVVGLLQQAYEEIAGLRSLAAQHTTEFEKHGSNGWLAMMNPPPSCFCDGIRALLELYLRQPALQLGAARWGFKEVRHGIGTARFLRASIRKRDSSFLSGTRLTAWHRHGRRIRRF